MYRVRWAGYGPDWDTWEPYDNLESCHHVIDQYIADRKKALEKEKEREKEKEKKEEKEKEKKEEKEKEKKEEKEKEKKVRLACD